MKKLNEIKAAVEATKTRGAWAAGVKVYALMILDTITERTEYEDKEPDTIEELKEYALNGARDWKQASEGGCYLVYNEDIARTLCNPTELKKTDNGRKAPNSRENWIDCQARALYQAYDLITKNAKEA